MKKHIPLRKLTLKTTTVRMLDTDKLQDVAGGGPRRTYIASCVEDCPETYGY